MHAKMSISINKSLIHFNAPSLCDSQRGIKMNQIFVDRNKHFMVDIFAQIQLIMRRHQYDDTQTFQ